MKDQCYQPKNPCLHQGDNLPINNSTVKSKQFLKPESQPYFRSLGMTGNASTVTGEIVTSITVTFAFFVI